MAIAPTHYIWQRERSVHHSGAVRNYKNLLHVARKIESSNNPKAIIEK